MKAVSLVGTYVTKPPGVLFSQPSNTQATHDSRADLYGVYPLPSTQRVYACMLLSLVSLC